MRHWVRYIGVLLLTGMLILGIGLRGLPAPCQNGHCGDGGCATSAHPCPPSCTCHWSHGTDGDCCHPDGRAHAADHGPAVMAAHAHHHDHGTTAHADHGHEHGAAPATDHAHGHDGQTGHARHPGERATAATSHCAPVAPAADDRWPNLSLPHVQPPALLAAGLAVDFAAIPDQVTSALPAVIAWAQPPPLRPPVA